MRTYCCINCGKVKPWKHSYANKFCSNDCQHIYKWLHETKPRIMAGGCSEPSTLKKFLVECDGEVCTECGQLPLHNGKALTLQIDHIDGNSDNNMPENLRLLCPNCHTQTETYGNAGKGNRYKKSNRRNRYLQDYKMGD